MLRPVANAEAFVGYVIAAGEAQDRRIMRDGAAIVGRVVEPFPGLPSQTPEQRVEAARKGGLAFRLSPEEVTRRDAARQARADEQSALAARRAEILRLRDAGLSFGDIAQRVGTTRSAVAGTVNRHGIPGEGKASQSDRAPRPCARDPQTGKQLRGFAVMSPEKRSACASKGGAPVAAANRSFSQNRDLASAAGKLGGECSHGGGRPRNPRVRFGLTLDEFQTYGVLRAKGFGSEEAAGIILRSRKPSQTAGA